MTKRTDFLRELALSAAFGIALAAGAGAPAAAQGDFRYDVEYPLSGYSNVPADNPVAELIAQMQSGEVELDHDADGRGYFDSLLAALDIDPRSQVLVYSKTSLQYALITAATPRALYFNDTVYLGFVQQSNIVEIATMDAKLGPVFYTFRNEPRVAEPFRRETGRCLSCHDTQGMMGGGVPVLPVRSLIVNRNGAPLTTATPAMTDDTTPFEERWAGWYVSGHHGGQTHLGNLQIEKKSEIPAIDPAKRGNLETLDGLFDTSPYAAPTSDIVALMVMEHQLAVQNQIAYVNFKAPAVLERMGLGEAIGAQSWDELPDEAQRMLPRMLGELADFILMEEAIDFAEPIQGTAGFEAAFEARGPRDPEGRSLRTLDLETRLFTHPVSFEIYSAAFDELPPYAREYIYGRIADRLRAGGDDAEDRVSPEIRAETLEILTTTKPEFAAYLAGAADS